MDIGAITNAISLLPLPAQELFSANAPEPENDDLGVFQAVDEALNLTKENRNVFDVYDSIGSGNIKTFLDTLADLLKNGVVGTELLDLGGRPTESFASSNFADSRLHDAVPWRGRNLDIRG